MPAPAFRIFTRFLSLLFLCMLFITCRSDPVDLFSDRFSGSIHHSTRLIQPNSQNSFDIFFRRGWERPDRTGAWSNNSDARIIFEMAHPEDTTLVITAKSLAKLTPPQVLSLFSGDHLLGSTELHPDFTESVFKMPSNTLSQGWNVLTLQCSRLDRPVDLGLSPDSRKLGACIHAIRFGEPSLNTQLSIRDSNHILSCGSLAEFFFENAVGSDVKIALKATVGSPINAEINIECESPPINKKSFISTNRSEHVFSYLIESQALTRVTVLNTGSSDIECSGSCRLAKVSTGIKSDHAINKSDFSGSILAIVLDACSPEYLSAYGAPDSLTPWIDSASSEGQLFVNAVSTAPYTISSTAAMLTGCYFNQHGIRQLTDTLSTDLITIAERLKQRGYYTVAFSGMPTVSRSYGFDRGFDEFHEVFLNGAGPVISSHELLANVMKELPRIMTHTPVFIYVHIREPHAPYHPTAPFHQRFGHANLELGTIHSVEYADQNASSISNSDRQEMMTLYRAQIAQADRCLETIHRQILSLKPHDSPLRTIFMSDHGESFGRHDRFGHNSTLFHDMMAIPLIILDHPLKNPSIIQHLVSNSLMNAFCTTKHPDLLRSPFIIQRNANNPGFQLGATDGRYQFIQGGYYPAEALFDRDVDPLELVNQLGRNPLQAARLRSVIRRTVGSIDLIETQAANEMTDALVDRLKAMGYAI